MLTILLNILRDHLRPRSDLPLENLALRQQINVLRRDNPKPAFRLCDRLFWIVLMRTWAGWRRPLALVQPATVIGWHRKAWRLCWRRIVHVNVTTHPVAAEWTALQLMQAFPFETAPRFIIRDRDRIYGDVVRRAIANLGSQEQVIAARSPWQNGYCERVVGTLKRECLNHVIVLNENHARRILKSYLTYYHDARTHLGLAKDTPDGRAVEPPELGAVQRRLMVGGLHSRYYRDAA